MPSGTKVTVLEVDDESGYTRVQTSDGMEGWLLTRYLLSNQTARLQLPRLQARLRDSEESNRQLKARGLEFERALRDLTTQLDNTKRSSRGLQRQLEEIQKLSSNTIQLNDQNKQLTKKLNDAERQIDEFKSENHALSDGSNRDWFIIGAAVIVFGIILGLIIPHIGVQRKSKILLP